MTSGIIGRPRMAYIYNAVITRIIDGDTLEANLDLGRHIWIMAAKHRIQGLSAREMSMPGGPEVKANLEALIPVGSTVELHSLKPYKYGDEYMCDIWLGEWFLSEYLIHHGWAARWNGRGAAPYAPWPRNV